jgi:hypothetical protein
MAAHFVTDEQIAHARALAREITNPIFDTHREATRPCRSSARCLRWFGVDGVGEHGALRS